MGLCQYKVNHDIFLNTCKCYLCCLRPSNHEELFNLYHASAQNIVEHVFGILKQCYQILLLCTKFPIDVQGWISAVLCALHNFIAISTPDLASNDISKLDLNTDPDLSDKAKDNVNEDSSIHVGGDNPIEVEDDIDPYPEVHIHVGGDTLHQEDCTAKEICDDIVEVMWIDDQCALANCMDLDGGNFDANYLKRPNSLKSWRLARARGRPLSVALNGKLKSKRRALVWQEWRWEISKWTRLEKTSRVRLGFIYCLGVYTCVH